jgi:hypothetical protein
MRNILIAKDLVYGVTPAPGVVDFKTDAQDMTDGAIAVFQSATGARLDAVAFAAAHEGLEIYVGRGATTAPLKTPKIFDNNFKASYFAYQAPVAKVMAVGQVDGPLGALNLPAISAGDVASLFIVDTEKRFEDKTREKYYEYVCSAGDGAAEILDGLVAIVNADTNRIVTLANAGDVTLTATSRVAGRDFGIIAEGVLSSASIFAFDTVVRAGGSSLTRGYNDNVGNPTVAGVKGAGTPAMVNAMERDFNTERGDMNSFNFSDLMFTDPLTVEAGATYGCWMLEWQSPNDNIIMPKANPVQVAYIFVANGANYAATKAILDAIFRI